MKQKSIHAEAAAAMRKELKAAFPTVKFSVRSETFAGGDAVRVSWVDGPAIDAVRAIIKKYQYGTFDGMTDSYDNTNVRKDIPQVKYVSHDRDMSDKVHDEIKNDIGKRFGIDMSDEKVVYDKMCMWPDQAVRRQFSESSYI